MEANCCANLLRGENLRLFLLEYGQKAIGGEESKANPVGQPRLKDQTADQLCWLGSSKVERGIGDHTE